MTDPTIRFANIPSEAPPLDKAQLVEHVYSLAKLLEKHVAPHEGAIKEEQAAKTTHSDNHAEALREKESDINNSLKSAALEMSIALLLKSEKFNYLLQGDPSIAERASMAAAVAIKEVCIEELRNNHKASFKQIETPQSDKMKEWGDGLRESLHQGLPGEFMTLIEPMRLSLEIDHPLWRNAHIGSKEDVERYIIGTERCLILQAASMVDRGLDKESTYRQFENVLQVLAAKAH